ncbi:SRPBCC family protein [Richelia sinica]|nr:SRPBCC family protein [Richelia sinica]MBD2663399.1 cyclase [Richelia sinica FACHB-800]
MSNFYSGSTMHGGDMVGSQNKQQLLVQGEVLVETRSHNTWGGAVTAWIYLPLVRSHVWQKLTDYPRWVQYFPDVTKSEIISKGDGKYLYQVGQKAFLFFTAQVEIYLNVVEVLGQQIQFRFLKGSFEDFNAHLELKDMGNGTLITYKVQATPNIPIPSIFIQQSMNHELPANLRKMRQVLCNESGS